MSDRPPHENTAGIALLVGVTRLVSHGIIAEPGPGPFARPDA
ncbi:hypothetical protein [Streptomyces monomycini]|nr:hypothetical protein [Streptomyces monomycini]